MVHQATTKFQRPAQQWKVERVRKLKEELQSSSSFIFTDYRGLNVQQITELRNSLRKKKAEFHVVKNNFARRVFEELGYNGLDGFLVGPTAIAYTSMDISEIAKILVDTRKETTLTIKGGYVEGSVLTADQIEEISKLPSRDVLIAQAIGLMNAPVRGLVITLNEIIGKFVRTLKAIEDKKRAEAA